MEVRTKPSVAIRCAAQGDLAAVSDLLSSRDERTWTAAQTDWFVFGLDPRRCLAWIAWDQERPVGLTTLFVRDLLVDGVSRKAGYWANLYVLPEYRMHMLYPRLPFAMQAQLQQAGIAIVYSANRLANLSLAHQRLGFALVGRIGVRAKPLRPARFVMTYLGWRRPLTGVGVPLDLVYGAYLRARRPRAGDGVSVTRVAWSEDLAAELSSCLERWSKARLRQAWSAESLFFRYRSTREGSSYHAVIARSDGELCAFAIYRIALRGKGVRVGVLMDSASRGDDVAAAELVLGEAERHAASLGADAMICLDGGLRTSGYRATREVYDMLVWPKSEAKDDSAVSDLAGWRFSFADHDAF